MSRKLFAHGSWLRRPLHPLRRLAVHSYYQVKAAWKRREQRNEQAAYRAWIKRTEPTRKDLARQRAEERAFAYRPLISIITPVFNPPPAVLRDTLRSVLAQTYSHWELCLADGNSQAPGMKQTLAEFAGRDSRIRVAYLDANAGISGNSNAALDMAQGEFVAFLDHDDTLNPDALYEVVRLLNANPDVDIIYVDEDKLSADGRLRDSPFFKPHSWSPEMLLSVNYLMHSIVRRRLIEQAGAFDPATDGTQDWDLMFRCTEATQNIVHIPKVLYHQRQVPGSMAADTCAKPYAGHAQIRCIQAHLQREGIAQASARLEKEKYLHALWPTKGRKVSIIIPTKENSLLLERCLDSLLQRTAYPNFEIILVDNGSREAETLAFYDHLRRKERICIVDYPAAFNYSTANNLGVRRATGDLFLFLNNDVEILEADWLEEMVRWAERPEIGAVGAKLLYPDQTIQHAGVVLGLGLPAEHIFLHEAEDYSGMFGSINWYRNYMAVTGACMMMRRDVFDAVGGFDDQRYVLAFSDVEICLRIRAKGYRIVYTPFARLLHHESATRGANTPVHDQRACIQDTLTILKAGDPYFNANLSHLSTSPSLIRFEEPSVAERTAIVLKNIEKDCAE